MLKRIADHLGDVVTFGLPLVEQRRNPHDLFVDLANERGGMRLTLDFVSALEHVALSAKSYAGCYRELSAALPSIYRDQRASLPADDVSFLDGYVEGMRAWVATFERLGVTQ